MKSTKIASCFCLIIFLLIIPLLILAFIARPQTVSTSKNTEFGSIVVTVLEKNTLDPIDNATVCVIETREYYYTSNKGLTKKISVPIIENANFNNSLKRNYGEITLLVYKAGYASAISFYNIIKPNTTNVGVIFYLSPIINEEDNKIEIISNTPDTSWATELEKLYKK